MITAVDTNVLLDVFGADRSFVDASRAALRACIREGKLVACEVVWAEVTGCFPSPDEAREAMTTLGVDFDPVDVESALAAGAAWKEYRRRGGRRDRVVADFLIGSHARLRADRLLSRDRGFYRAYLGELDVLDPASQPPTRPLEDSETV